MQQATCNLCFVVKDYLKNDLAQLTTVELVMFAVNIEKIDFKQKDSQNWHDLNRQIHKLCIEKRILFVIFRASSNKRKDHKSGITPTSVSVEEVDFGTVLQRISTSQVGARIRGVQLG